MGTHALGSWHNVQSKHWSFLSKYLLLLLLLQFWPNTASAVVVACRACCNKEMSWYFWLMQCSYLLLFRSGCSCDGDASGLMTANPPKICFFLVSVVSMHDLNTV